jgi:ERCC4-type nuclease
MSSIYLITDSRERYLHKLIDDTFTTAGIKNTVAQINTGDYLICEQIGSETNILACIERKTLKDYAASFKDGRYRNSNKMIDLRNKTGCQLYYFVEGSVFLSPSYKIAGIPYKNIMNSITNQMIRDNIHTVRTKNEQDTVDRMLDFVQAFEKIDICYKHPIIVPTVVGGSDDDVTADVPSAPIDIIKMVTGKAEKDDITIVTDVWATLPGISIATARNIVDVYSIADMFVPDVDLTILKTPGGRAIVKKGMVSLRSLIKGCRKIGANVLSGLPGISKTVSTQIMRKHSIIEFMDDGAFVKLSNFKVQQKNREVRLGDIKADRIIKFLRFKNITVDSNTSP